MYFAPALCNTAYQLYKAVSSGHAVYRMPSLCMMHFQPVQMFLCLQSNNIRSCCVQDAPMLAELATALRGVGKHAEAERCCTAAVNARPDYQRGWLELGRSQAAQGCRCHLFVCRLMSFVCCLRLLVFTDMGTASPLSIHNSTLWVVLVLYRPACISS